MMWLIFKGQRVTIVIFVLPRIYWSFTKDQTVLTVEPVDGEYVNPDWLERCLSSEVSRRFTTFQQRAGVQQLSPELHPGSHPSSFLPQTRRNTLLILHNGPHQRRSSSPPILRESDRQSETFNIKVRGTGFQTSSHNCQDNTGQKVILFMPINYVFIEQANYRCRCTLSD